MKCGRCKRPVGAIGYAVKVLREYHPVGSVAPHPVIETHFATLCEACGCEVQPLLSRWLEGLEDVPRTTDR